MSRRRFDVEFRQRRVVGTGASDQHVVDGRRQLVEEPPEPFEVGGIEGRGAQRADFARGALEALRISAGENHVSALTTCSSGSFEPDSGAATDDNNGLPEELRSHAHDFSDHQSKIAFGLRLRFHPNVIAFAISLRRLFSQAAGFGGHDEPPHHQSDI